MKKHIERIKKTPEKSELILGLNSGPSNCICYYSVFSSVLCWFDYCSSLRSRADNIYIVHYWGLVSAQGQYSNGRGQDNVHPKGGCIICPRPLLYCPSTLTSPEMHCKVVYKLLSTVTDLIQP